MAYWLFKTEPDEFSIDDLQALGETPEPWDGIRNYQARNLLRDAVAEGDEVFIYHSSCKHIGVAGTATVVRAAYPDPDQFNPAHKYFDAKAAPDNVRWYRVDVVFQRKFQRLVTLADIKAMPGLENMMLLKQGRLSIQPVTPPEWATIITTSETDV
ncbi:EVE domain-containing protein [Halioglobus sp. HI00S01]|uniref:EVE domain-containing protein n=1 Tax=Halioglobus sp. HI00S01 TaxID=1822214 RepID=UPI0007C22D64|nr:EVE domain-containing protein [Halioglobus sp. HI00S01]KZX55210.1 EVE domain-containing protein [Halioglobus sp. HI00S01]